MARIDRATSVSDQRESGRQKVISTIRKSGQIARIDIAQKTGVSPATVTSITSELLKAGLIEEIAPESKPDSRRGRPRVALKIRGEAHIVAGLKVASRNVMVALIDFEGNTVSEYTAALPASKLAPEAMAEFIANSVRAAASEADMQVEQISGLGIGVAGIIDAPRGFVYWSPSMTERNVSLRDKVEALLPIPVFIDNDANLVAMAEQLFGMGKTVTDFIVVTIEHGVGMGIVIDNALYRGTRGCGAEFGHTKVHLDGALCRCGQRGCLEAYVADYALLREASITGLLSGSETENATLDMLFRKAKAGDTTAQSIFHRAGRMFAIGLANIVNIFDPELIILSGERMQFDYLYADEVLEAMKAAVIQVDAPLPEVRIHKWGDLMWAKGAAAFAMDGVTDLAIRKITDAV
ncbi:ROK family transcriptional regulator [Pseudoruegeria sp. SHC-113]|uniref:ROK family transcriptional regulator n=1 Tax=Pseudoruegeria sp. SHC-113 TaxID=2855439 RepID=UPI0021BAD84E|nr:ROK family transcriptional regulator [Pseudoruegeria sp. SHC-113]MCT8161783.1 ROK family transcriptional regulator [Pseudoruegeria sp. SHC-113]